MTKKSLVINSIVHQNIYGLKLEDDSLIPRPLFISFEIRIQKHLEKHLAVCTGWIHLLHTTRMPSHLNCCWNFSKSKTIKCDGCKCLLLKNPP